jgi:hypothetical protein
VRKEFGTPSAISVGRRFGTRVYVPSGGTTEYVTETTRAADLDRLYDLFDELAARVGGPRRLGECHGRMEWPDRGVYFFFAPGETRDSSAQSRLTRVGTHAVSEGSGTSLWDRVNYPTLLRSP